VREEPYSGERSRDVMLFMRLSGAELSCVDAFAFAASSRDCLTLTFYVHFARLHLALRHTHGS
jgi:hypothetical protein